jgi:hypothetical protein
MGIQLLTLNEQNTYKSIRLKGLIIVYFHQSLLRFDTIFEDMEIIQWITKSEKKNSIEE